MTAAFAVIPDAIGADTGQAREIGGLDNQCVALPVAPRVPQVLTNIRPGMGSPVQWDDARLMNHLIANYHVSGNLQNLISIVVHHRNDRAGNAARDATVVQI